MVLFLSTKNSGERDDRDDFFDASPKATYKLNFLPDNKKAPRNVISLGNWWIIHNDFEQPDRRKINHIYSPSDRLLDDKDSRYHLDTDPKRISNPSYTLDRLDDSGVLMLPNPLLNLEILAPTLPKYHATGRHRVVTTARQTGDVPHVAAALALDPLLDVLIICGRGDQDDELLAAAAELMYINAVRFDKQVGQLPYIALGENHLRIKHIEVDLDKVMPFSAGLQPAGKAGVHVQLGRAAWRTYNENAQKPYKLMSDLWSYKNQVNGVAEYATMNVGGCTTLILNCFNTFKGVKFYKELKEKLPCDRDIDNDIIDWASKKNWTIKLKASDPPAKNKETVLLVWSRYSGSAPNGYNPAGDSSVKGQGEIIKLAKNLKIFKVIITIGHSPANTDIPPSDIHLGEFWKEAGSPFVDRGRPGQISFYRLLAQCYNVVQVGQKTGGMDNAALIGIPTVYIEDEGSPQSARMQKWSKEMTRYKRAKVPKPPTPLGKAIRRLPAGTSLADAKKSAAKEDDGYLTTGVEEIRTALALMVKETDWSKI